MTPKGAGGRVFCLGTKETLGLTLKTHPLAFKGAGCELWGVQKPPHFTLFKFPGGKRMAGKFQGSNSLPRAPIHANILI